MTTMLLREPEFRAVEFRATDEGDGDGRTLEGYGAVFDTPTTIQSWDGEFEEEIARGAFKKTLKQRTPVLQFDHGRDPATGTVPIGQIQQINEDDEGLFVAARLYDNPKVEPIRQAIEGKSIDGMSIRFLVARDEWRDRDGKKIKDDELYKLLWEPGDRGPLRRTILEINPLYELGPVVFPAYTTTSVGVRSIPPNLGAEEQRLLARLAHLLEIGTVSVTDLSVFTGRPGTRSAGGGESDAKPQDSGAASNPPPHLVLRHKRLLEQPNRHSSGLIRLEDAAAVTHTHSQENSDG